jgi:hypothetical protein
VRNGIGTACTRILFTVLVLVYNWEKSPKPCDTFLLFVESVIHLYIDSCFALITAVFCVLVHANSSSTLNSQVSSSGVFLLCDYHSS